MILLLLPIDLKAHKNKIWEGLGQPCRITLRKLGSSDHEQLLQPLRPGPTAQGTLQGSNATQSTCAPGRGLCFIAARFCLLLVLSLFTQGSALEESQTLGLCFKDSQISALKVPAHHLGLTQMEPLSEAFPGHLWWNSTLAAGILLQVPHSYHDLKLLVRLLTSVFLSPQKYKAHQGRNLFCLAHHFPPTCWQEQ